MMTTHHTETKREDTTTMPDYVIRWDLKIEADTPDAAATEVVRVLRALYSTMTVSAVAVTDEAGRPVSIDLSPEENE